ncbi:hypothetical protein TvY486_0009330 [Trypanosoma vivax Y486]|uniref:Uncharacterized protein n=1 Tax=Trypanosoma vivax (strain Y486) TaxID=1055687 RepID=F9WL82_TRYVY|nr:hypothetical protein TvY486_0009330 [Trypanosoma vivax Y486]|eukprot:CCD18269.1 hypothetical protein TvY486_0009330 [Trypanosoma vivax Y486]
MLAAKLQRRDKESEAKVHALSHERQKMSSVTFGEKHCNTEVCTLRCLEREHKYDTRHPIRTDEVRRTGQTPVVNCGRKAFWLRERCRLKGRRTKWTCIKKCGGRRPMRFEWNLVHHRTEQTKGSRQVCSDCEV